MYIVTFLKPSLSIKTLSINNFAIKLFSKLPSDLGSKTINRQYFRMKKQSSMKKLSINNLTIKLLSTF